MTNLDDEHIIRRDKKIDSENEYHVQDEEEKRAKERDRIAFHRSYNITDFQPVYLKDMRKPSSSSVQAHPDIEQLGTTSQANNRADRRREAGRLFSDTCRAPSMLPERIVEGNEKIEQSNPKITSNRDKSMIEQLGIKAVSKDLQQRPAYQARSVSSPNEACTSFASAGGTPTHRSESSAKLRKMRFRRALIIHGGFVEVFRPDLVPSRQDPLEAVYAHLQRESEEVRALSPDQKFNKNRGREATVEALRWLVQDAKSGDSFFLVFGG